MIQEMVISMMTALIIIAIVLVSGGSRIYFRRKYDVSEHINSIKAATDRQKQANTRLHNVQNK